VFGASAGLIFGSLGAMAYEGLQDGMHLMSQSERITHSINNTEKQIGSFLGVIAGVMGCVISEYLDDESTEFEPVKSKAFFGSAFLGVVTSIILGNTEIKLPELPEPTTCLGAELVQNDNGKAVTPKLPAGCSLKL